MIEEASKRNENDRQCSICYQDFSKHERTPFIVCNNEHIVCRSCLFHIQSRIFCPFCRAPILQDNIKVSYATLRAIKYRVKTSRRLEADLQSIGQEIRDEECLSDSLSEPADFDEWGQTEETNVQEEVDGFDVLMSLFLMLLSLLIDFMFLCLFQSRIDFLQCPHQIMPSHLALLLFYGIFISIMIINWIIWVNRVIDSSCTLTAVRILNITFVIYLIGSFMILAFVLKKDCLRQRVDCLLQGGLLTWSMLHFAVGLGLSWKHCNNSR